MRDKPSTDDSEVLFNQRCPDCEEYLTNELAGICAGGMATSILMPDHHVLRDTFFDEQEANGLLNEFVVPARQSAVEGEARRRARSLIEINQSAVVMLRDVLVNNHGFLDVEDATRLLEQFFADNEISH